MIEDARVLQPEFQPREVVHRDAETQQLSNALEPLIRGERPETALLYGPSGVGKTCIARFTVERLREQALDVEHQYVNCWEDYTPYKTLYRILEGINQSFDIHRQSTPQDVLLERLRDYNEHPYVVILDEVDQLDDKSLLYDLYRIRVLTMVLIANEEDGLFATLDDRVNSRLSSCMRIKFQRYTQHELSAILRDRVRWGLTPEAIPDELIAEIADAAAGDARAGIGILRNAARHAQREGSETITAEMIETAVPETHSELKQASREKLNPHQEVLYDILQDHGAIQPGELYRAYENQVDDSKTKRTVRNHLSKLEHYNLIESDGNTRARTYRLKD